MTDAFNERLDAGLCPRCGERFGKDRMDETSIQRVDGTDPEILKRWGPYQELIAPCGHRVKCYAAIGDVGPLLG